MKTDIIPHDFEWAGALTERGYTDMIVVHHTASNPDITVEDIHQMHLRNGWTGIGYHLVIYPDGSVHQGRPIEMLGAHCQGYNNRSIGINLTGNFEEIQPTQAQVDALVLLLADLMRQYNIPPEQVTGHNVWNATACPGANLDAILPDIVAAAVRMG
jgi:N-acetyl-anhydromuramyl-L-alanine amidase AmpD